MEEKKRSARRRQYGISMLVGFALSFAVAYFRGLSASATFAWNARYLSDGFFVVGMLMACFGVLMLIGTTDFFDIFVYGFKSLVVLFTALKNPRDHIKYYDFKQERAEKRGGRQYFLLFTGLLLLALAVLCTVIYYKCK